MRRMRHSKCYTLAAETDSELVVVYSDSNIALQEFLRSRNPNQQHSATLESFLIKPIQRILKYPLLLRQLTDLTDPNSEEHAHLCGESNAGWFLCSVFVAIISLCHGICCLVVVEVMRPYAIE
jgi:hypothetical protein